MSDERLIHYSDKPLGPLASVAQPEIPGPKPRGLWVSVDSCKQNWRDWCEGERWGLGGLTHVHDVTLAPGANLLRLSSAEALDNFTLENGIQGPGRNYCFRIVWPKIAARYQGIVIAPYIWSRRYTDLTSWYYGWDCASGCIWDARAVERVTLRPDRYVPQEEVAA